MLASSVGQGPAAAQRRLENPSKVALSSSADDITDVMERSKPVGGLLSGGCPGVPAGFGDP